MSAIVPPPIHLGREDHVVMGQSAEESGLLPLQVSFKGAMQMVQAFATVLWTAEVEEWEEYGASLTGDDKESAGRR